MVLLSPGVWTTTLKLGRRPVPLRQPGPVLGPARLRHGLGRVGAGPQPEAASRVRAAFTAQHVRAQTGLGV